MRPKSEALPNPCARAVLRIRGHVQGVGFRASALQAAREIGIAGFIRNLSDGSVEAVAEGDPERIGSFINWCHQGPPAARVREVGVVWSPPQGEGEFRILNG